MLRGLWCVLVGLVRTPTDRVGAAVLSETGRTFTAYRETVHRRSAAPVAPGSGAVLAVRFRPRALPDRLAPYAVRALEALSALAAPFVAGRPGFRRKLSLSAAEDGEFLWLYEWTTAGDARRYARTLDGVLDRLAAPDSIATRVREDVGLEAYLRPRTIDGVR